MTDKQGIRHSECDDLVEVLYEYVDGGCDEHLRQRLAAHVNACPSCLEQLGIEQQVRQLLRARCCNTAPDDLRGKIVSALRTTQVTKVTQYARVTEVGGIAAVAEVTEVTEVIRRGDAEKGH